MKLTTLGIKGFFYCQKQYGLQGFWFKSRDIQPLRQGEALCPSALAVLFFLTLLLPCQPVFAQTQTASWYDRASCIKESGQAVMANGKELDDEALTCASWDYPFNTILEVVNVATKRSAIVVVTDRGPAKRLYKKGRTIDLSKAAFRKIADLKQGVIEIQVEEVEK